MVDCIFCKIANKEIVSELVYETNKIVAFKDVNPVAPVHILIIPKEHICNILELANSAQDGIMNDILKCVQILSEKFKISESGFRLVNNCGQHGGQTVDHMHFHLVGGRYLTWPPG